MTYYSKPLNHQRGFHNRFHNNKANNNHMKSDTLHKRQPYKHGNKNFISKPKQHAKNQQKHQPKQQAPQQINHKIKGPLFDKSRLLNSWKVNRSVGPGLLNSRNTCFLNSVLECLTYTPALTQYLLATDHGKECKIDGFCALCAMQLHTRRCFVEQKSFKANAAILPKYFTSNLKAISKNLTLGRQEDAHEFYMHLLSAFQKASVHGLGKLPPKVENTDFIYQVFGGKLQSQLKCYSCKATSNTYQDCLDLSVDLNNVDSLKKALDNFTKVDIIGDDPENRYKCDSCKQMVKAGKQMTISELPLMLTVHLKRFAFNFEHLAMRKVHNMITYPETLDMAPYVSSEKKVRQAKYKLYAVLVHSGQSCNYGHYYAYVKAPNDKWYIMDDDDISEVPLQEVLKQRAYMLFYRQESMDAATPAVQKERVVQQRQKQQQPAPEEAPPSAVAIPSQGKKRSLNEESEEQKAAINQPLIPVLPKFEQLPKPAINVASKGNVTKEERPAKKQNRNVRFVDTEVVSDSPLLWTVQPLSEEQVSLRGLRSPDTYASNVNDSSVWRVKPRESFLAELKQKRRRVYRKRLESLKTRWVLRKSSVQD